MKHLFRASLALIIACAALFTLLKITYADEPLASSSAPAQDVYLYLPMIAGETNPAGAYFCYEWEFGFTNFHWLTATFQPPNRLWASKYLTYAGFEIAISCSRLP